MDFEALFQDKPEEWNGLLVHPVRMRDYPMFLAARESITAMQQTFPYPYSTMRYLEALYGMEHLFSRLALLLALVFGFSTQNALPIYPRTRGDRLEGLLVAQGERKGEITPRNFGELRALIARQNGIELPDETENAELVEAQRELSRREAVPLKADVESLVYAVAIQARADPLEVLGWTVRRFQATERALDRWVGHQTASAALAAGGKFKGGNPYPSWKYDREERRNAMEPLSALSGRLSGSVEKK